MIGFSFSDFWEICRIYLRDELSNFSFSSIIDVVISDWEGEVRLFLVLPDSFKLIYDIDYETKKTIKIFIFIRIYKI